MFFLLFCEQILVEKPCGTAHGAPDQIIVTFAALDRAKLAAEHYSHYFSPLVHSHVYFTRYIWLKKKVYLVGCFLFEIGYQP